jgi:hypothetical protein
VQYHPGDVVQAATSLANAPIYQLKLLNITQPAKALFFLQRWMADLTRQPGALAGVSGRDVFNFGGWAYPQVTQFNPSTPLIGFIDAKSGSNYLVRSTTYLSYL